MEGHTAGHTARNTETFPRQQARTQRFTLGRPRTFSISPNGSRVLFLRTAEGGRGTCLWSWHLDGADLDGGERLLADPSSLLVDSEDLPPEERARRERARETASGIVAYATDRHFQVASFALGGRLFVVDIATAAVRELPAAAGVMDPRPDPTGRRVAYVAGGALRVVALADEADQVLASEGGDIAWGAAEFVASEEIHRFRGYWWSPDGERVLAARVDESAVPRIYIGDPAHPDRAAAVNAYPAAGTVNADVSLHVLGLDGSRVEVAWDTATFPYLVAAEWDGGDPIIAVQTRDQRTVQLLQIDPADGACSVLHESRDEHWWEIVPGLPARLPDGRLVWTVDESDTRRLTIDGEPLTPEGLQVRSVADVGTDGVLFTASMEPTEVQLWLLAADGSLMRVSDGVGVHSGRVAGGTFVVASQVPDKPGVEVVLRRDGGVVGTIASYAERPVVTPAVRTLEAGERGLRTAVLLPQGHVPGSAKLPVLMAPYGGPGAQRVLATQDAYLSAQWLADQGFAVVVADGRGTPGRGPSWEREIAGDFATAPLQDQVDALHAAANRFGDLDLDRVGIMGWSFGGYLSALAVLRRPDVFHAAVAGAPVTDWTLYDTHYTERYLGVETQAESYRSSSLLDDAPKLERPLLIIHGLADDNVVAAHSLRLSSALLAAGKPHSVLPLSGVTHMTPQEEVAENLLLLQVDFLRRALTN